MYLGTGARENAAGAEGDSGVGKREEEEEGVCVEEWNL